MFKQLIAGVLLLAVTAATTMAFAEDVYVTKRGKKYHKEMCRVIQNREVQKVDDEGALEKGLSPCRICFKQASQDKNKDK